MPGPKNLTRTVYGFTVKYHGNDNPITGNVFWPTPSASNALVRKGGVSTLKKLAQLLPRRESKCPPKEKF